MSKLSRDKGKAGEREVCEILRPLFPNARRRLGQERAAADNGRDLDGTQPFCIQVKRHRTVPESVRKGALVEAWSASGPDYCHPVVIWREDRGRWRVTTWARAQSQGLPAMMVVECSLEDWLAWFACGVGNLHPQPTAAGSDSYTGFKVGEKVGAE